MLMRKIFTSVDIGTSEIKVVTLEVYNNKYNVLASSSIRSSGVKQGLIVDANLALSSLKKVIKMNESKLGTKITQVLATVPTKDIEFVITTGDLEFDEEVVLTGDHLFNCMQKSLKGNLTSGTEVVGVFPIEYTINKSEKVQLPLGVTAKELEIKSVVVTVPKKNVYSVVSLIENLGIEVVDISIIPVSNYYVAKNADIDKKIVAVVDIGYEKINMSVFNKGVIIKSDTMLGGGIDLDNDIVFSYKVEEEVAKKIKSEFAVVNRKYADGEDVYTCKNRLDEKIDINQYNLAEILETRVYDLLKNIKIKLNSLTNREIGYIIFTGGVTSILGFNALVEEMFSRNASVMNMGIIGIRENKYSVAYGSILYFVDKLKLREKEYTMFLEDRVEEMLSTRKKMGAASVLGKIFGKIFD